MHDLGDPWPYLATAVTMISGIAGFFWARSGERNKVGGVGWTALVLIVVAGVIAITQAYRAVERARVAGIAAAAAEERLRQTQLRQSALLTWLVAGLDMKAPVKGVGLNFIVDMDDEGVPARPNGFIGPFPDLGVGGRGQLVVQLSSDLNQTYNLSNAPGGGIAVQNTDSGIPIYTLRDGKPAPVFTAPGVSPEDQWLNGWSAQPESGDFYYGANLPTENLQYRRLFADLAQERIYGGYELRLPGLSAERRRQIADSVTHQDISFVIAAEAKDDKDAAGDQCTSYIRVPLSFVARPSSAPDRLLFNLVLSSASDGFRTEICEGGP
ncbi:MAG: hypothetical protein JWN66_3680 [Sphingomonas bacterium]|uniref:hypothetical protein n=1 Tax=Sphingomonas bacterium TaxID=1895847 RepID=UPI0026083AD4|nr:hypothetical protein [Sphingomonas bacterium]MDB5706564.1 hypothetical protein [Sphingomonas bacterium]